MFEFTDKTDVIMAVKTFADMHGIPLDRTCLGGGGALMLMEGRVSTVDLNLWVDEPHFSRLCERFGITNHPMTDTFIPVTVNPAAGYKLQEPFTVYVRERNRYFKHVETEEDVNIFDVLTLSIHKHGGLLEVRRPLAKRKQDREDIKFLKEILAVKNKVKDAA